MVSLLVLVIFWIALCVLVLFGCTRGLCGTWWAIIIIMCCLLAVIGCCVVIARQPRSGHEPHFEVPFVPWIPILSVMANVWLMIALSATTWIRFAVWLTFGKTGCRLHFTTLQRVICMNKDNKKAQLSLTNPRDAKACQNCSNLTCLQRCR